MKKTFKELRLFNVFSTSFLVRDKNHAETKLGYAIKSFVDKNLDKIMSEYNEALNNIRIDECHTDDSGVIVYDITKDENGNEIRHLKFTKEGLKNKNKREKELLEIYDKKEYDIESCITKKVPENLTMNEIESFKELVIPGNYINPSDNGLNVKKELSAQ